MSTLMQEAFAGYEWRKKALVAELNQLTNNQQAIHLHKQTSNLFRHRKNSGQGINVRDFNHVINIDKENLIADVEGMTTYDTLVKECLKHHCLPTVVPELKTITVGGALTGGGIESSSFRYGLVHETILEHEVVLSDGRIILCSPNNEYKDLYTGFPNSYGTLGYALKARVKLYPAKPYIKLTHLHYTDKKNYFAVLQELCLSNRLQGEIDFIEGVVFDPKNMYITIAQFVDHAPYLSDYTHKNIYYLSIKQRQNDYLTTYDYIWRWDTDWFWCSKFFFAQNPFIRTLLGKKRLNSATYWQIRKFFMHNRLAKGLYNLLSNETESIIQDVQIPIRNAAEFLTFFEDNIGITPIWLCPTMPYRDDIKYDLYAMDPHKLYINFGFWDTKPLHKKDGYYNNLIEKKVGELAGKKSLYSNVYYTEDEFWHIYNKESYEQLKNKFDPDNRLKSLYEKCSEKMI